MTVINVSPLLTESKDEYVIATGSFLEQWSVLLVYLEPSILQLIMNFMLWCWTVLLLYWFFFLVAGHCRFHFPAISVLMHSYFLLLCWVGYLGNFQKGNIILWCNVNIGAIWNSLSQFSKFFYALCLFINELQLVLFEFFILFHFHFD